MDKENFGFDHGYQFPWLILILILFLILFNRD
ncbi:hypothetical protein Slip_0919 [Syntrophothermus lipocalidus DSM 12680]|uniref:Uncharacterized protein n=1 Tax=Syntrophothermus lipocalidus (strain DSM 12680 / TGB-C1) TaxID=643648 RepID=D7CLW4_SYNLT|nr:hypothetical protein Slip_0919 [Syntrophothermus lipocalidus DSM 12680]